MHGSRIRPHRLPLTTLVGLALAVIGGVGATGAAAQLPGHDCVQTLRRARLAPDPAATLAQLRTALELPTCELPALVELDRLAALGQLPEAEEPAIRGRITALLADPAVELPRGLLLGFNRMRVTAEEDAALLAAIEQRLARAREQGQQIEGPAWVSMFELRLAIEERQGQTEAARATVEQLRAIDSREIWEWQGLGLDQRLGRWESVAATLERWGPAARRQSFLAELYLIALAKAGRLDALMRELDAFQPAADLSVSGAGEATPFGSALPAVLVEVAWALRDAGRDEAAEQIFRRLLTIQPDNTSVRRVLVHLYADETEGARLASTEAHHLVAAEDPGELYADATNRLAAGDAAGAFERLERAAPRLGGTTLAEAAWYNLGLAAWKLERWERAAEAFGEAAKVRPDRADTHYQRGVALYHLQRWAPAAEALERTLQLDAGRYQAHYFLSACYHALGRSADASRHGNLYRQARPPG